MLYEKTKNILELQQALSNGTWKPFNPETVRMMIGIIEDALLFIKNSKGNLFNIFWFV